VPSPRRVHSPRTNMARTRAGSRAGSSSRSSTPVSSAPLNNLSRGSSTPQAARLLSGAFDHEVRTVIDQRQVQDPDVAQAARGLRRVINAGKIACTEAVINAWTASASLGVARRKLELHRR